MKGYRPIPFEEWKAANPDLCPDEKCGQGGKAAYREQVERDRERWEALRYREEGPVEVFVFGSNRQGIHGAGAAKRAAKAHGAIPGRAEGRQGRAYAIVTKELRPGEPPVTFTEVARGVLRFLDYAEERPRERFLVTRVGCGLAGFDWERQVRPLFDERSENVILLEDARA